MWLLLFCDGHLLSCHNANCAAPSFQHISTPPATTFAQDLVAEEVPCLDGLEEVDQEVLDAALAIDEAFEAVEEAAEDIDGEEWAEEDEEEGGEEEELTDDINVDDVVEALGCCWGWWLVCVLAAVL